MHAALRSPENRSTGVIDALRDAILTGRYAPGEHLVQEELAAAFGISRIPLREALRRLEGEGLVVMSPNRGAVVRPLILKDVVDLYDLRLALESLALRRAAERYVDVRAATQRRHEDARSAIAAQTLPALFHLDRDFHAELAAGSDNPHLIAALDGQWSQIMRVMHAFLSVTDYPPDVWPEHEGIANAVAHGDGALAVARLSAHLLNSRDTILKRLRAYGDAR
ncbi:MAG: GntR family transcriptional regulator [Candidatus Velthaea sp.]